MHGANFPEVELMLHFLENIMKHRHLADIAYDRQHHTLQELSSLFALWSLQHRHRQKEQLPRQVSGDLECGVALEVSPHHFIQF